MTAAGRGVPDGLSIGAVLAQLRPDFPDVTISKIRFLETEGLVSPARTASGYRQFTAADVERLRFVLAAQRDHYLPLKVIKEQLDATGEHRVSGVPRALVAVRQEQTPDGRLPAAKDFAEHAEIRLTREDMLARTGIDAAMLAELEQYGLVKPGAAGFYDSAAAHLAKIVKSMTEYGIEPRHLRAFRASAEREVGLLEQIVAPIYRHRDADSRERADEVVRELAALSVALHTMLVKAGLRRLSGG